jgi:hypothetical protein
MVQIPWEQQLAELDRIDAEAGRNWHDLIDEAVFVAEAVEHHWPAEVTNNAGTRSSLRAALPAHTARELREIAAQLAQAVREHALAIDLEDGELGACAAFVANELTAALSYLVAETAAPDITAAFERLRALRAEARDSDALAARYLRDCARLALDERAHLHRVPEFDVVLIEDALTLADALRTRGREMASGEGRNTLHRRDRLATYLTRRLDHVRRTAWFIFRHHRHLRRSFPHPCAPRAHDSVTSH